MTGWQPIETAPKDGTPILIYFSDFNLGPHFGMWATEWNHDGEFQAAGWFHWGPLGNCYCVKPTHWMPLPEPPDAGTTP